MEKSFSVVIETESGEKQTVTLTGESPSGVFQLAKAMPGVRRVGRVVEAGSASSIASSSAPQAEGREQKSNEPRATIQYSNTGPRVVTYGRPQTGHQPFKHFSPPPESLAPNPPPRPPEPLVRKAVPAPAPIAPPPSAVVAPEAETPTRAPDYRVMKSRRQSGEPYFLQRGYWQEKDGKRLFTVEWEKGFPDREKAAAHQQWITEMAAEVADTDEQPSDQV